MDNDRPTFANAAEQEEYQRRGKLYPPCNSMLHVYGKPEPERCARCQRRWWNRLCCNITIADQLSPRPPAGWPETPDLECLYD